MYRMLSLQQRSLLSDRPLPVRPLPGGDKNSDATCTSSAGATDADGYPTAISRWSAGFAAHEYAASFPAAPDTIEQLFSATASSLHDGRFAEAREQMHRLCLSGQLFGRALRDSNNASGTAPGVHDEAALLESWVADCATLLQYVPELPPAREDHKRLLMLLHDLGGSLMLFHLLGALSACLLPAPPLADLAGYLGQGFGEWNRKTALSRAIGLAERSGTAASQLEGAELLREYGMCTPALSPQVGQQQRAADGEAANDMWAQVGVRACATLLLRGRRVGEAMQLLRALVVPAATLHAFLSAFELGSRLPAPPLPEASSGVDPLPTRFSLDQMLEVLEAALQAPQHGLASEGNLLRWQLRSALQFGQAMPPRPPLACPPPPPMPQLRSPRVLIAMPFVDTERARLTANIRSWRDKGGLEPCAMADAASSSAGKSSSAKSSRVDMMLYSADRADVGGDKASWFHPPEKMLGGAARCFRRVVVRHANLSATEQHYLGGWDNVGPNNLFFGLFLDPAVHKAYDVLLWMETDMVPVQQHWLVRLLEEATWPRGYWRKGPAQQPRLQHAMVSTHHYHMNSAGLYRLGQPCFVELMRRVAAEHARQPHDVSTHLFLHDPRHFHIWQAHAHRFHYTDLVQNRLDTWSLEDIWRTSPDTVFVHGKSRKA